MWTPPYHGAGRAGDPRIKSRRSWFSSAASVSRDIAVEVSTPKIRRLRRRDACGQPQLHAKALMMLSGRVYGYTWTRSRYLTEILLWIGCLGTCRPAWRRVSRAMLPGQGGERAVPRLFPVPGDLQGQRRRSRPCPGSP